MIKKPFKTWCFGRLGNKTREIKNFKELLPMDCKNIIEPFGGSFAVIRNIYYDYDTYNLFVNDNDTELYQAYMNIEKIMDLKNKLSKLKEENIEITDYKIMKSKVNDFFKKEETGDNKILIEFLKKNVFTGGFVKFGNIVNCDDQKEFIKHITFSNDDYKIIMKKHQKDKNAFIFLDPPYLFCDNSTYGAQNEENDMSGILLEIKKFFEDKKTKCKVMLIINNLEIIRYLFKDYIKKSYPVIYQVGKKKNHHLCICNYDI